jgi:hypothetical protein
MVEALFTRKDSYFASEKDMDESGEAARRMPSRTLNVNSKLASCTVAKQFRQPDLFYVTHVQAAQLPPVEPRARPA